MHWVPGKAAGMFGFLRASSSALSKTFVAILRAAGGDLERKVQINRHVLLRIAPKLRQDGMQPEVGVELPLAGFLYRDQGRMVSAFVAILAVCNTVISLGIKPICLP